MYSRAVPPTSIVKRPLADAAAAPQPRLGTGAPASAGVGAPAGASSPEGLEPTDGDSRSAPRGDASLEPGVAAGSTAGTGGAAGAAGAAAISGVAAGAPRTELSEPPLEHA